MAHRNNAIVEQCKLQDASPPGRGGGGVTGLFCN